MMSMGFGKTASSIIALLVSSQLGMTGCIVIGANQGESETSVPASGVIKPTTREIPHFTKLDTSGFADVSIKVGAHGPLEIRCDEALLPYLKTQVNANKLRIYFEPGINSQASCELTVNAAQLERLDAAGSGTIKGLTPVTGLNFVSMSGSGALSWSQISSEHLSADLTGSGSQVLQGSIKNFEGEITGSGQLSMQTTAAQHVSMKVTGSGHAKLQGIAQTGELELQGSANIDAQELRVQTIDIRAFGSGNVTAYAERSKNVRQQGSGKVTIGGPAKSSR